VLRHAQHYTALRLAPLPPLRRSHHRRHHQSPGPSRDDQTRAPVTGPPAENHPSHPVPHNTGEKRSPLTLTAGHLREASRFIRPHRQHGEREDRSRRRAEAPPQAPHHQGGTVGDPA
jgi:hypothetical protein